MRVLNKFSWLVLGQEFKPFNVVLVITCVWGGDVVGISMFLTYLSGWFYRIALV